MDDHHAHIIRQIQMRLRTALEGLEGIRCIANDILVYGEGNDYEEAQKDHDRRFIALMERCHKLNIKLNAAKLQFKFKELKFIGTIISDQGMKPDPNKVAAITQMQPPENKAALLRFIGMVNYLSSVCGNMSSVIQPLRILTQGSVPFIWSKVQDAKQLISSAPVLAYYDLDKPVVLQTDASGNALGGALLQPNDKEKLRPYWTYRDELSVQNGIIYKGTQLMVPQSMHKEMLRKIHANHFGAESNIRMAREVLFWPGMRKSIQDMCDACGTCAQYGTTAPKKPMRSLPIPTRPWQMVSQDICEILIRHYLVTVCHFSDWIEVDELGDTLSSTVINKTKAHFARYGVLAICHTDNGPQFISEQYRAFSVAYGFKHTTSSPFHPKGNGRAEAAVKVAESMLKKDDDFHSALLLYRNTPPRGHTYSPAQRMFLCRTRTLLPTTDHLLAPAMINFGIVKEDILKKRHDNKVYYENSAGVEHKPVQVGSYAYAKPQPRHRSKPWIYGEVI